MTSPVVLPLWGKIKLTEASKETLLALWQQILTKTGVRVNANEKVTALRTEGDRQVLTTSLGEYRSAHVVLALGRRGTPRKLRVPGEDLPKVTYRLMDTESYQRCKVLIVGGGDSAVEAALGLALQGTNQITLSYRGEEFQRIKERNRQRLQDAVKRKSVTVLFRSQVTRIEPETVHLETAEGARVLQNDYVFIFAGGEMPFEFLRNIGIRFQETVIA
jgi:thioredoxin reductase